MKTFLAVGDKPLPVVTGEPGSSVAAAEPEPAPRPSRGRPEGRISGRVYDENGKPVNGASVRLAVGATSAGKIVRTSTDRSGGFTLKGLVPGANYTVIAEWEGNDGPQTGRAEARANDPSIQISLAGTDNAPAVDDPNPGRINRVSDRELTDPEEADEESEATPEKVQPNRAVKPGAPVEVNEEDLPPAPEAEAFANPNRSNRLSVLDEGWRRGANNGESAKRAPSEADLDGELDLETETPAARRPSPAPLDSDARGTSGPADAEEVSPLDDGPNPLPPALEPGQARKSDPDRLGDRQADTPARLAQADPRRSVRLEKAPEATSPFDSPSKPTQAPPAALRPVEEEMPPGALVVSPETFAPVQLADEPYRPRASLEEQMPARVVKEPSDRPAAPSRTRPTPPEAADDSASADLPSPVEAVATAEFPPPAQSDASADLPPAAESAADTLADFLAEPPAVKESPKAGVEERGPRRRPTWGEVAANAPKLPLDEGANASGLVAASAPPRAVAVRSQDSAVKPACDYDDRHRRLIDFELPSLDGRPVHFKDLDADLVLLDFWGTWCAPCVKSIPHLVDLQARTSGKKLAVVGIACEKDVPEQSRKRVLDTVQRLRMNYLVLLSRNDGTCPLQEALHIQALPTMVLLDREGRVLWRDTGATSATLARLDRMIATATKAGAENVRRY